MISAFLAPQIVRWDVLPRMSGVIFSLRWDREALDLWARIGPRRGA